MSKDKKGSEDKGSDAKLFMAGAFGTALGALIGCFFARSSNKEGATVVCGETKDIEIESFYCSICTELMKEPVVDPHGHCFCRECIEDWLERRPTCPMTNTQIQETELRRCIDLANAIEEYRSHKNL
jgi:hypothetical protein